MARAPGTSIKWSPKQKSGWTQPLKITFIKEGNLLQRKLKEVTKQKTSGKKRPASFRYRNKGSGKWRTFTYKNAPPKPGRMAAGWSVTRNRRGDGFTVHNKMDYAKAVDQGHKHVPKKYKRPAYFKVGKGGGSRLVMMSELKRGYSVKGKGIVKEALRRAVLSSRKPFKAVWSTKGQIRRVNI